MKVELRNVAKSYGERVLFENLNEVFESGKISCIFGLSGSGKTTLLNIIGLIETYDGEILYDGLKLSQSKDKRRFLSNKVGFIFQNFGLLENETVLENFKLIKKYKNTLHDKTFIAQCLENVGMVGVENKAVYKLSGGEQQRVAIAKILYKDPDIILADEPTASLDENNKEEVIKLLYKMRRLNKTIIIVTHDLSLKRIADKIIDL